MVAGNTHTHTHKHISSGALIRIGTVQDQESRKKKSAKISSTRKVMERQEENTPINQTKGYKTMMLNKTST